MRQRALQVSPYPRDVTQILRLAVAQVEAEHHYVSLLVNNAGYALQGPVEDTPIDAVRAQFETNVFGLVRLTQLVLPGMIARGGGGTIVNITSASGYADATKAAGDGGDAAAGDNAHNAASAAMQSPAIRARMEGNGFVVPTQGSAAYTKFVADELNRWTRVIKVAGIKEE